jgi:hypothetical protein
VCQLISLSIQSTWDIVSRNQRMDFRHSVAVIYYFSVGGNTQTTFLVA